jgi:hypothetical protein
MSMIVQRTFNKYQAKGQKGQVSRPSLPFSLESNGIVAGDELKPGYGVYRDSADGKYKNPTDAATARLVTGVVHFVPTTINSAISSPSLNNDGEVVIAADSNFELLTSGHIYVTAGGNVRKGDLAISGTSSDGTWAAVTGVTTDNITNPMVFEEDGEAGDIVSIRVNGQINTDNV